MGTGSRTLIQRLSVLSLFFLLALCAMAIIASGAGVWRSAADGLSETFSSRTATAYVAQKVRQSDEAGGVSLTEWQGLDALCLHRQDVTTYLYYFDGALREVTLPHGVSVSPSAGQTVVPLQDARFEDLGGSLYRFTAQSDTGDQTLLFTLLCEEVCP